MRVCLEHHMNFDRTGYPEVRGEWGQATLSRIVAVADCFDAITAHRAYNKRARTPFEGLQYLLGPTRVKFDPAVLWALVRTVGLYPAGTLLQTESGHVVLALGPNAATCGARTAACWCIPTARGGRERRRDVGPDAAIARVVRVLRPEEYPVDTSEMLAA